MMIEKRRTRCATRNKENVAPFFATLWPNQCDDIALGEHITSANRSDLVRHSPLFQVGVLALEMLLVFLCHERLDIQRRNRRQHGQRGTRLASGRVELPHELSPTGNGCLRKHAGPRSG